MLGDNGNYEFPLRSVITINNITLVVNSCFLTNFRCKSSMWSLYHMRKITSVDDNSGIVYVSSHVDIFPVDHNLK